MTGNFRACDKDSSAAYTASFSVNSADELGQAWEDFKASIPFSRWYSDNEMDEGDAELLEDLD